MKPALCALSAVLALAAATSAANAATAVVTTVSASNNNYSNSVGLLNDGVIPANTTVFDSAENVYFTAPNQPVFTFDFTGPQRIGSFLATVDNNDDYTVTLYNGSTALLSRTILGSDGVVTAAAGGVETFTSAPSGYTYVSDLAFSPVVATSATVSAANGDGYYAIGEVDFFKAAAPEPATWAMMLLGLGAVGAVLRGRRKEQGSAVVA